ncbi:EamA family transporter [Flocculibacter collagenilyticus]|uniref:EamA family transporter n=1 Tax=Flocculibacter collagenilyticus TaxID=2744479 RepID=UPI0018F3C9EE|nr:EamA family transporter [Flocculibacter collagenilyticus]
MINNLIKYALITAIAPIIWGSTYLVTTELLPADTPLFASVIRALPAGLLLLLIGGKLPKGVWWFRAIVLGALNIGAFFYFLFVAAYHLPGGIAALVMSCQPILVLVLGALLLSQRIKMLQIAACAVGILGVALLVLKPVETLDSTGVFAGLAGALSMAIGIVLTKRWGRPEGVSVLNFTGWQLAVGGLVLLPLAFMHETLPSTLTLNNWIGYIYLSVFGAVLSYMIWFKGLERLPAISVSFISFASPLTATILGYVFLNQTFNLYQIAGAVAIIAAILMAQPRQAKPTTNAQSDSRKPAGPTLVTTKGATIATDPLNQINIKSTQGN